MGVRSIDVLLWLSATEWIRDKQTMVDQQRGPKKSKGSRFVWGALDQISEEDLDEEGCPEFGDKSEKRMEAQHEVT